jgi:hypothetical protein
MMNDAPPWLDMLRKKAGTKVVLLVEGSVDETAMERWLSLIDPDFGNRLLVRRADDEGQDREFGGTKRVKQGLTHEPGWWGLVDSDERTDAEIADDIANLPRLRFLPRYCLESFFIEPAELWNNFPLHQRAAHSEFEQAVEKAVLEKLDRWVAHFAMWRTLCEREQRLRKELNFPQNVIREVVDQYPLSHDQIIESLKPWHEHFDPAAICREYEAVIATAAKLSETDRLRHFVHGKHFFHRVVLPVLNTIENKSAAAWISDLIKATTTVPADLRPILEVFVK